MIVLAIIGTLIGISTYGVGVAMRNSRESQRTEMVGQIKSEVENFYLKYGVYPSNSEITFSTGQFRICNAQNSNCQTIPVNEDFAVPTSSTSSTTTSRTAYCYTNSTTDRLYALGFKNEKGEWKDIGTSKTNTCLLNSSSSTTIVTELSGGVVPRITRIPPPPIMNY
jgi:type II secretory pathway pseudopilin PulG